MKKIVCTAALALVATMGAYAGGQTAEPAAASDWTGGHIGMNVGGTWQRGITTFDENFTTFAMREDTLAVKQGGAVAGAELGYDWQLGEKTVIGVETDFDWSGLRGTHTDGSTLANTTPGILSTTQKITWFGTVRPIFGFLPLHNWLLYVTGGFAYGHIKDNADTDFRETGGTLHYPGSREATQCGWTAGAGGKWKFHKNWSANLLYLYYDLNEGQAFSLPAPSTNPPNFVRYRWTSNANVIRLGMDYHFSA